VASYDEAIPPGEVGKLDVTLKTKGLRGKVGRSVTLTTNDPAHETTRLTVQAEITGSILLVPYQELMVGSARGRHQRERLIVRKDPTEEGELAISNLRTRVDWLRPSARKVEEEEPGEDGFPSALPGDWILEVDLDESAPPGSVRIPVEFDTALSREPHATVQVLVGVVPPVIVRPTTLRLAPARSGQGLEGVVHAVVRAGLDLDTFEVEASSPSIEVDTTKTGPRHFRVHAVVDKPPDGDGPLTLIFRVAGAKPTEVPVMAGAVPTSSPEVVP
jgi:hypothetical protein